MSHTLAMVMAGKGARKLKLKDFLLSWAPRKQSPEEQLNIFRALARKQESHVNDR